MKSVEPEEMDDAISREETIRAITKLCDPEFGEWAENPHIDAILDVLENLPPVRSTVIEVEGKLFDCSKAIIKTHHPGTGEYGLGGFWEVEE